MMADLLNDPHLVDVVWLDDCHISFQLNSGINRYDKYCFHEVHDTSMTMIFKSDTEAEIQ